MALLDVLSILSAVVAVVPIAKNLVEYRNYRKHRRSIEASLRLHKIVLRSGAQLASLEVRDKTRRRVLITPSELDSSDSVCRTYEILLEKDLSKDHELVRRLVDQLTSQQSALDTFERTIDAKQRTTAWKVVNAGLIQAAIASKLSDLGSEKASGSSILGLMLGRRMDAYARAYAYSLASLVVGLLLYLFLGEAGVTYLSVIVPLVLLLGLTANQRLLQFRVSRGYFGNNASEAAEFIRFIQSHSDKSDFNDGDRMRRLLPEQERDACEKVVIVGQGAPA